MSIDTLTWMDSLELQIMFLEALGYEEDTYPFKDDPDIIDV